MIHFVTLFYFNSNWDTWLHFTRLAGRRQPMGMLADAALNYTAKQIRPLFAIVLTTCFPTRAETLWDNHKDSMSDDILMQRSNDSNQ